MVVLVVMPMVVNILVDWWWWCLWWWFLWWMLWWWAVWRECSSCDTAYWVVVVMALAVIVVSLPNHDILKSAAKIHLFMRVFLLGQSLFCWCDVAQYVPVLCVCPPQASISVYTLHKVFHSLPQPNPWPTVYP